MKAAEAFVDGTFACVSMGGLLAEDRFGALHLAKKMPGSPNQLRKVLKQRHRGPVQLGPGAQGAVDKSFFFKPSARADAGFLVG